MKITSINNTYNIIKKPQKNLFFKGFDCAEQDFEIKRLYNIPCPICSATMIQRNQIDAFVAFLQNAKGEDIVDILTKYRKFFHKNEALAAEILSIEAQKYPNKNISELAQNYLNEKLPIYKKEKQELFEKINQLAQYAPSQQQGKLLSIIAKHEESAQQNNDFDKEGFIKEINEQVQGTFSVKKKIIKIIQNFPDVKKEGLEFFIKYANKTQAELASRFVTPSFATCEHIKPKSKGGENNTANYLAECEECNSKRNDTPLLEWITNVPAFVNNFKSYIQTIASKIQSGEIPSKYSTYLDDISQTISKETQGKIKIKTPKITQENFFTETGTEERIAQLEKTLQEQIGELKRLEKLKEELDQDEQYESILRYRTLESNKSALEQRKKEKKEEINKKSSFFERYRKKSDELDTKKEALRNMDPTSHEAKNLVIQIHKLKSFLNSKNPKTLEEQIEAAKVELSKIQQSLLDVNEKLETLKKQIEFPEKIKEQIAELKSKLQEVISTKYELDNLILLSEENPDIIQKIKEKEAEIQKLLQENSSLEISLHGENDIDTYLAMTDVIKKTDEYLNNDKNQNTPKNTTEITIYELAKQKANEIIAGLAKISSAVKVQINLQKISELTSQLHNLYIDFNNIQTNFLKAKTLKDKLDKMPSEADLKGEIKILSDELEMAKKRFDSVALEIKIKNLKEAIKHKERALSQIKAETSEDAIRQILSTI